MSTAWIDYDDGHAGGYPHDCGRCDNCGHLPERHGPHCMAKVPVMDGPAVIGSHLCTCPIFAAAVVGR